MVGEGNAPVVAVLLASARPLKEVVLQGKRRRDPGSAPFGGSNGLVCPFRAPGPAVKTAVGATLTTGTLTTPAGMSIVLPSASTAGRRDHVARNLLGDQLAPISSHFGHPFPRVRGKIGLPLAMGIGFTREDCPGAPTSRVPWDAATYLRPVRARRCGRTRLKRMPSGASSARLLLSLLRRRTAYQPPDRSCSSARARRAPAPHRAGAARTYRTKGAAPEVASSGGRRGPRRRGIRRRAPRVCLRIAPERHGSARRPARRRAPRTRPTNLVQAGAAAEEEG
jgi:hypothetical protein